MSNSLQRRQPDFDWATYADATLAGLSVLIPIPLLDLAFEYYFRTRMPRAIAKRHKQELQPTVVQTLNRKQGEGFWKGCLTITVQGLISLIKRISRKILYFLTVKEATDMVSRYWHQAFLLNRATQQGHLDNLETAQQARAAIDEILETITTSPLAQLAQNITEGTRHIFRSLRQARQGTEDDSIEAKRAQMQQHWADFAPYFDSLAVQYDQVYLRLGQRGAQAEANTQEEGS